MNSCLLYIYIDLGFGDMPIKTVHWLYQFSMRWHYIMESLELTLFAGHLLQRLMSSAAVAAGGEGPTIEEDDLE